MIRLAILVCLLAPAAAYGGSTIHTEVSGRVITRETSEPVPNQEVEVYVLKLPVLPLGMGSYVKTSTTVRTDADGYFKLSAEVPRNRRFELRTRNPGFVYGGGMVTLDAASSITGVTIEHVMPFKAESLRLAAAEPEHAATSKQVFRYRDMLRMNGDKSTYLYFQPGEPLTMVLDDDPSIGFADNIQYLSVCPPGEGICFESLWSCFAIPADGKFREGQEWRVNGNHYRLNNVLQEYQAFGREFGVVYVIEHLDRRCQVKRVGKTSGIAYRMTIEPVKERTAEPEPRETRSLYYYSPVNGLVAMLEMPSRIENDESIRDIRMRVIEGACGFGHSDACAP